MRKAHSKKCGDGTYSVILIRENGDQIGPWTGLTVAQRTIMLNNWLSHGFMSAESVGVKK